MTQIALHMPLYLVMAADLTGRVLAGVSRFFEIVSAAGRAQAEIKRVGRLTDRELAANGLNREAAYRDVFTRHFD